TRPGPGRDRDPHARRLPRPAGLDRAHGNRAAPAPQRGDLPAAPHHRPARRRPRRPRSAPRSAARLPRPPPGLTRPAVIGPAHRPQHQRSPRPRAAVSNGPTRVSTRSMTTSPPSGGHTAAPRALRIVTAMSAMSPAPPVSTVAEVIARMEAIGTELPAAD